MKKLYKLREQNYCINYTLMAKFNFPPHSPINFLNDAVR